MLRLVILCGLAFLVYLTESITRLNSVVELRAFVEVTAGRARALCLCSNGCVYDVWQDTSEMSVVAFQGESHTRFNKPLFQAAHKLASFRIGHVSSDQVSEAAGRKDELVLFDPSVFRENVTLKAAQAYVYRGQPDPTAIEEWIWKRSAPLVGLVTPSNYHRYVRTGKPVLKLYLDRLEASKETERLEELHALAGRVTGRLAAAELRFALADRGAHEKEVTALWGSRVPAGVPFAITGMTPEQGHLAGSEGFSAALAEETCKTYLSSPPSANRVALPLPHGTAPMDGTDPPRQKAPVSKADKQERQEKVLGGPARPMNPIHP